MPQSHRSTNPARYLPYVSLVLDGILNVPELETENLTVGVKTQADLDSHLCTWPLWKTRSHSLHWRATSELESGVKRQGLCGSNWLHSGAKATMAPILIGMVATVLEFKPHPERMTQMAPLVDEANGKQLELSTEQVTRTWGQCVKANLWKCKNQI